MGKLSKTFVVIGVAVQLLTVLGFCLWVRPLTVMALVCLCFGLFAELQLFGGLAVQYGQDHLPVAVRCGYCAVSGLYTVLAVAVSAAYLRADLSALRQLLVQQLVLLAAAVFLNFLLLLTARALRNR